MVSLPSGTVFSVRIRSSFLKISAFPAKITGRPKKHLKFHSYYTNICWEGILDAAEKAGVAYYVVEQDECPGDPFESLRLSSEYLHKHFMR